MSLPPFEQPATLLQRHPGLRWFAPIVLLGVAALVAADVVRAEDAGRSALPATSPAALVAAMKSPTDPTYSGTVVTRVSLGLSGLHDLGPAVGSSATGLDAFTALLDGSHTLQYWYGGATRQRVTLLGSRGETDLFRDGDDIWQWDSQTRTAVHSTVADAATPQPAVPIPATDPSALTPSALASHVLAALDPTTDVRVEEGQQIADRPAYELVLVPKTTDTTIGEVRIGIDGATKVPLQVQVYGRGAAHPAVDVAFSSIHFGSEPDRNFEFTAPPGATVRQAAVSSDAAGGTSFAGATPAGGSGWSSVVTTTLPSEPAGLVSRVAQVAGLTPVSGAWGSGDVLDGGVLSMLVTSDGRVFVGAVAPARLYAAAGH